MNDKIIIKDLRCEGLLGIYDHEQAQTQPIIVNVVMWTDIHEAADSLDITKAVDYEAVCTLISNHIATQPTLLVETLITNLADQILGAQPRVSKLKLRIEKPTAIENAAGVGVEIKRRRKGKAES